MSNTTLTVTTHTLIAAGTSLAAGGVQRATLDVRGSIGGFVTLKISNGVTGPTIQCEGRVLVSHKEQPELLPISYICIQSTELMFLLQ